MKYTISLTEEARQDEAEAYNYYEDIRAGLGEELLIILEQHYKALSDNPFLYSYIDGQKVLIGFEYYEVSLCCHIRD